MKHLFILIFLFVSYHALSQDNRSRDGIGFDSYFQNYKKGNFQGQVSGELNLVKSSGESKIINIDKENAILQIVPDSNEVYDVSKKDYFFINQKGNISIKYSTYASANAIALKIDNVLYELSLIDGACDLVIKQIEFVYKQNVKQEVLYLFFTGKVGLSYPRTCDNPTISIQPGSILIFAIEKLE